MSDPDATTASGTTSHERAGDSGPTESACTDGAPSSSAIVVEDLTKRFGEVTAVDGISFAVEAGSVFGFLGPNGAGKTTTTRMLTGVLRPDAGTARIVGHDVRTDLEAAQSEIGIVPERFNAYLDLTAWQNLMLAGEIYGLPTGKRRERGRELLRSFGLFDRRDEPTNQYSKGMKQRLMLAMALIHDPAVLFLDEPITGLDVESQRLIRERLAELNRQGRTVFLTTHDIDEADELCDTVAIINRGRIAAVDSPGALKGTIERTRSVEVCFVEPVTPSTFDDIDAVESVEACGDAYRLGTSDPDLVVKRLVGLANERDLTIQALRTCGPSLEDAFLALTEGAP
ncbi:MAG: ABC transporter ATP-binding protein [Halanaeroarchaeum sp.]